MALAAQRTAGCWALRCRARRGPRTAFPAPSSRFAAVQVQENGFSLRELLMPSLIWFTHRHVFQVLIITVFMLITSPALSARIHILIHQLPS